MTIVTTIGSSAGIVVVRAVSKTNASVRSSLINAAAKHQLHDDALNARARADGMMPMSDRPIPFSAPMIAALLAGRKTQARRLFWTRKDIPPPHTILPHEGCFICRWPSGLRHDVDPRYNIGDRLWVREAWRATTRHDHQKPSTLVAAALEAGYRRAWCVMRYEADGLWVNADTAPGSLPGRLRASTYMPRAYSRLTLTVTDVRVQRLQDISAADAVSEGLKHLCDGAGKDWWEAEGVFDGTSADPVYAFSRLWDSINGPDAWGQNPWVTAYTFTVRKGNIDNG